MNGQIATAEGAGTGIIGNVQADAVSTAAGLVTSMSAAASAAVDGSVNTQGLADIGGPEFAFPSGGSLDSFAFATGLPDAAFVASTLAANGSLDNSLGGAQATLLGFAINGGEQHAADGVGTQSFRGVEGFTLDAATLSGQLILGLVTNDSFGSGFADLALTVSVAGTQVLSENFTTLATAQSFFDDNPVNLGYFPAVDGLAVNVTFDLTTTNAGDGFGADFLLGSTGGDDPPMLTAPSSLSLNNQTTTPIGGITLTEPGAVAGETYTLTLSDTAGLLAASGAGVSGSGTNAISLTGSLDAIKAALTTLTDTEAGPQSDTISLVASDSVGNTPAQASIVVNVACYCEGTLIRTVHGEMPIKRLAIGDRVMTLDGTPKPIRWVGRRSYDGRFIAGNLGVLPIVFRAGALGEGVPARDLRVSPRHAMFLDDVLIAAELLVNGVLIVQAEQVASLTYYHLELDDHAILLAEGAFSESFIDRDSRMMFQNAHEFVPVHGASRPMRECALRIEDGEVLQAVRRRLAAQAGLAADHSDDAALHGALDGRVDQWSYDRISGWALDPQRAHTPIRLEILDHGVLVGETLANLYRADLEQSDKGRGRCAFAFTFPTPLDIGHIHRLQVRRVDDHADLPGVPLLLQAQPAQPGPLDGRIDDASHLSIHGWALDVAHPDIPVLLEVMDGEASVGRVLADLHRFDLAEAGRGRGRCAFFHRFALPLCSQVPHRLWLRRASDNEVIVAAETQLDAVAVPHRRALFIDHAVPTADRDAGSQAAMSHMQALIRLGFELSFASGPTSNTDQAADPVLTAAGITHLTQPDYVSIEDVLRREGAGLHLIYLHRFETASLYGALARHHAPQARLVYSVADLHYLRLARQATVQNRAEPMALSRRIKPLELMAAATADAVITHSTVEAALLRQAVPNAHVHVVPWAVEARPVRIPLERRRGIAFIGNYGHAPNVDAAEWLMDAIMPLVWSVDPDIACFLVGADLPQGLRRPGERRIVILGHVDDLADVFERVRLTVAPLRFGAGVKGKVVESLAAGVPCVCTTVAAEGVDVPAAALTHAADTAADLAALILRLHGDHAECKRVAETGRTLIGERFSVSGVDAAMLRVVGSDIDMRREHRHAN